MRIADSGRDGLPGGPGREAAVLRRPAPSPAWTGLKGTKMRGTVRDDSARGAPPRAPWRSGAIVGVKLVHSAIFLINSAAILHIFVAGIRDRPSQWTRTA